MATFDYSRTAATASRLITKFGQAGTVERPVPGNGPANNPGKATPLKYAAQLVVIDWDKYTLANNLVQSGSKRALVAAKGLAIEIKPQDVLIERLNSRWIVVKAKQLNFDGATNILFDCEVTRA